ncbi:MAG: hypothetical protein VXY89_09715 [SAR324 cluster bacterium]|nr:hypothetical protein [SAR324 cluster bacterium]|tara:strand:+ start:1106 stop:1282 length:177 start_codon:yes stop_codon:yes gene_type:complete
MGKIKAWLMEMEDDALDMTREEFIKKHGKFYVEVWTKVQTCRELEQLEIQDGKLIKTD